LIRYKSPSLTTTRVVPFNGYYSAGYRLILDIQYPTNSNSDIRPSPDIRTWLMENWTIQLFENLLSSWISGIQPFLFRSRISGIRLLPSIRYQASKSVSGTIIITIKLIHFSYSIQTLIVTSFRLLSHIYSFIGKRLD